MKRQCKGLLAILLIPLLAWGLTLKKTSIKEMTETSDLVIQGYVLSQYTEWNENRDLIYTFTRVQVNESYKGIPEGDVITVRQMGGRIGDTEMVLDGTPELKPGSDVLLFLVKKENFYKIHSIALGKFDVKWDSGRGEYMAIHGLYGVNLLDPESKKEIPGSDHFSRYPLSSIIKEVRRAEQ